MSDFESTSMTADLHRECWTMLPWVVTGRISATDRQRIERHLPECAECRAELEQQRRLCEQIRRDEPVMLAPQASFQKLMARIDGAEPVPRDEATETASSTRPHAAPAKHKRAPRCLAIAAGLQAIAIGGLLALVWQLNAPRFTTQFAPSASSSSGVVLRVVFRPEMTNAELQDLLHGVGARVVAGPTEAGVYTLSLPQARAGDAARTLAEMRADPNVVFAEHVFTEPAQ